jgi:protein TonB
MNRSFFIPTAVACSAHAFLLFGFSPPARVGAAKPPPAPRAEAKDFQEIKLVEEEKPAEVATSPSLPPLKSQAAPPSAPDRSLPSDEGSFVQAKSIQSFVPVNPIVAVPTGPVFPEGFTPGNGPEGPYSEHSIVYTPASLDAVPQARFQTPPAYPYALKSAGISGEVLVEFVVDEQGRVREPRILRASHPEFEAPSLSAVSKWRFEPGMRKNVPVRFLMRVPLSFNLDQ